MSNIAFIDGQNLNLGTKEFCWKVDHKKFRIYLKEKYNAEKAYYFLGYLNTEHQDLYTKLQESGFIIVFKEHSALHASQKKGNVDVLMVFTIMREIIEQGNTFNKVLLVTGDGDFYDLVKYLIEKGRFVKILHPAKESASSLYKSFGSEYYDFLENPNIKPIIELV